MKNNIVKQIIATILWSLAFALLLAFIAYIITLTSGYALGLPAPECARKFTRGLIIFFYPIAIIITACVGVLGTLPGTRRKNTPNPQENRRGRRSGLWNV
ncbi:MAG: hypothetical protein KAU22_01620 [Desulfuromonadales bacterium]|nr:hypothetical protein [Desulfuromonadales bacterium]